MADHSILGMLCQRIYGLARGYEDLNDYEQLRRDPVFGALAGRKEFEERLAGKSTLNRMELGAGIKDRYKASIDLWHNILSLWFSSSHLERIGGRGVDRRDP